MKDAIIILILLVIVGVAVWYIYKSKKSGKKCIGCPDSCSCTKSKTGCCCGQIDETDAADS